MAGGVSPNQMGQGAQYPNTPGLGQQPVSSQNQQAGNAGYTFDPVQNRYVPTVGSAANQQQLQQRALQQQGTLFNEQQQAWMKNNTQPNYGFGYGNGLPQMPTLPSVQPVGGAQQQVQQIQFPNMSAAQQAAFNTAKNQQGLVTASALAGLQNSLAGRGLLGGGYEGKGTTDIVQQGAQALGDLTNQQAQTQANQALQTAQTGYQGAVQQRGQDINSQLTQQQQALQQQNQLAQQALSQYGTQLGAGVTLRGQDINAQLAQQQQMQNALNGLSQSIGRYYY